jgi:Fur family peroxide stress response transcriptional regulator
MDRNEIERRLERFKTAAKDAGIKLTHQRLVIFKAVASSLEHPSAEAVHRAVQATTPTVSLDTVYRTLWLLTDLGLLSTLGLRQESVRFDANVENHHHYICTRCGLVRDFESDDLGALKIPDTVNHFGQVVSTHVEVRGICDRCAKESSAALSSKAHESPRKRKRSNS